MLVDEGANLNGIGVEQLYKFNDFVQGQSGVDNIFHQKDIPAFKFKVGLFGEYDLAGGGGAFIGGRTDEVDLMVNGNLPGQVRQKNERALEDSHKHKVKAFIVLANPFPDFPGFFFDFCFGNQGNEFRHV
eukprot:Anaeramoba_ignava/a628732_3.p2 GENE.a628732_3~~a628732_3.p2  ORF type:complete len:130 (-),score=3.11 a628732_3:40-429(-)